MNKIESRLQNITGILPNGVAGTRVITELTGSELHMVSGGAGVSASSSSRAGGTVQVRSGGGGSVRRG